MDVVKKEPVAAAAAKQTAVADVEIITEAISLDSETTPAVVFSGSSFFPVCVATAAGETTGTVAAEITAEAVIPAGFLLFSFFCAETTAAAADFQF